MISHRAKSSNLRKVKTDAIDAYRLGELYYKGELEPYKKRGVQLLNLRNLTRQHENITGMYVQTKLQFPAVLDQIFPQYRGVFGDLHSIVSLLVLKELPASEDILAISEDTVANRIKELCKSRLKRWAEEKAKAPKEAAVLLETQVMLLTYQDHV